MVRLVLAFSFATVVLALPAGCRRGEARAKAAANQREKGTRVAPAPASVVSIYKGGLQGDWEDHGWGERGKRKAGDPERLDLSQYAGWILVNWKHEGLTGGLSFRVKAPPDWGDFFEVRLDSEKADVFPRVVVGPQHRRDLNNSWSEIFIGMNELNPQFAPFDHLVLRARVDLPKTPYVEVDDIALTEADPAVLAAAEKAANAPGVPARFSVDCKTASTPISPYIYGIAFSAMHEYQSNHQWKLGASIRRWGGNPTSRYNWELGNAWNTAADYYFRNVDYVGRDDFTWKSFLTVNREHQVGTALTLPTIGWVAKDTKSFSYPTDEFGPQQDVDPDVKKAGNGKKKNGSWIEPGAATRTSIVAPPDFIGSWVKAIRAFEPPGERSVNLYMLDNEPALWHDTHHDVHPQPLSYDELLDRTIRYGTAVRQADPQALIAGPAEWGWPAYFFSALDADKGFQRKPDRRAHGDVPLIEWYLAQLKAHEAKTGVRVLDVLDLHYYPQGNGIGVDTDGNTDAQTNALRIRSTRSLWDPTYTDESWIKEKIELLPRMKRWVDTHYPGLKLSIGEWSFGAERHPSGGIALAEALGRFGQSGLWSAFYWTYPPEGSPAFWAFRAYRNYDGEGAVFQKNSLPSLGPEGSSLFAAKSDDGQTLTLVALNHSSAETLDATVDLKGCPVRIASQRVFTFAGDPRGPKTIKQIAGQPYRLPPYGITTIEIRFDKPQ
jgi:hypothetical protein